MTNTDILERDIGSLNTAGLEKLIDDICGIIHKACEESMPTKKGRSLMKHRPLWWTEKLTDLKKEVIQLHHRLNRMRRRNLPLDQLAEELNNKKAIYAEELRAESSRSFKEFCELQTKENVWTLTNRLLKDTAPKRPPATIKIGDNYTSSETETAQALLDHFYGDDTPDNDTHQHQFLRSRIGNEPDGVDEPPFAVEEMEASSRMAVWERLSSVSKVQKLYIKKRLKLHTSCSVFQAELLAIKEACEWTLDRRLKQGDERHQRGTRMHMGFKEVIQILSDSQAALRALQKRSNTHPIVAKTHDTIYTAAQVDLNFIFSWVKGHAGDAGNEIADETAKGAATQHKTPDYAKFPMSFVKRTMREKTWRTWQTRYESAEQGARTKELLPKLTDICALWKATKVSFQLTQALTGHGYHKEYLHRFKIAADPFCPCDNTTTQTLTHLLRECPRFEYNRLRHEMLCSNLRISPYCVTELSNKQSAIESFVTFINYIIDKLKGFNKL
ncbi:unnamed protein product [Parnassius apollo]|uniref:(apollo) hypothetical protein n=1 Tax=Parnassius apollo TaxID=110799 RepID=A0A8S3W4A0_PARAO|nr:unnamed protein product [Parnassius apollo]